MSLIPYRTFLEVPQPASDFVFRISEGRGGAPAFKLVAADGGLWKSQAVDNVKNYLTEHWQTFRIAKKSRSLHNVADINVGNIPGGPSSPGNQRRTRTC
mgnify:CR=1 FL=1